MSIDRAKLGRVPSRHQLGACRQVLEAVASGSNRQSLEASYSHLPTNGLYSARDLALAQIRLTAIGLLVLNGDRLVPSDVAHMLLGQREEDFAEYVAALTLENLPAAWLGGAAGTGRVKSELIPDDELRRFRDLGFDAERRDALLLAAAIRHDAAGSHALGLAGEKEVLRECRSILQDSGSPDLAREVIHAASISDQLGYDVKAPDPGGAPHRMEVKTTSSSSSVITFFLSRNEASVGARDGSWSLVICQAEAEGIRIRGWTTLQAIADRLPVDPEYHGRWASAQVTLARDELNPGLPVGHHLSP